MRTNFMLNIVFFLQEGNSGLGLIYYRPSGYAEPIAYSPKAPAVSDWDQGPLSASGKDTTSDLTASYLPDMILPGTFQKWQQ